MGPEERWDAIRAYVVDRLAAEVAPMKHGGQAEVARELGCSGAHLSNMVKRRTIQPGEVFVRKAAARWGMTYAQLERVACGDPEPPEQPVLSDEFASLVEQQVTRILERKGVPVEKPELPPPAAAEPPAPPSSAKRR